MKSATLSALCLLVGACLLGCVWLGTGKAIFTTPNGDFGFIIEVEPNEDGSPGTLKATLDAESFDIIGDTIKNLRDDEAGETAEGEDGNDDTPDVD